MSPLNKLLPLMMLGLASVACMGPSGPRVHVASATRADLEAVQNEDTIWYEFRAGDVVPFQFLLIGVAVSGDKPIEMRATRDFWLVMSKDAPMQISYDGETLATNQVELLSVVMPGPDERATLVWLNYVGEGNAGEELDRISNAPSSAQPAAPAGEAEKVE